MTVAKRFSQAPGWRQSLYLLVGLVGLNQIAFIGARLNVSLDAVAHGASTATIGLLVSSLGLSAALTALLAGRWVEAAGARRPMLITSATLAMGIAIGFVWRDLAALLAVCVVVGVSYNSFYVAQQPLLGLYGRPEDRVRNFAIAGIGVTAAGFVAPLVTGFTIDRLGHDWAYLVLALMSLSAFAMIASRIPAFPRLARANNPSVRGSFELLRQPELRAVYLYGVSGIASWQVMLFLIPLYGVEIGLSASSIGVVMGATAIGMIGSRVVLGPAVKRFGAWAVLVASLACGALGLVILPFLAGIAGLAVVGAFIGAALGTSNPLAQALLYDQAPAGRVTQALTLWTVFGSSAQTMIPAVAGTLGAVFGIRSVFWGLAVILAAICTAGYARLARRP